MAEYIWPSGFEPDSFEIGLRSNVAIATSAYTGAVQTQEIPGARWVMRLVMPPSYGGDRQAEIEAFMAKVRGQGNRILMWHLKRPVPRGTMRGTPIAGSGASQGSQTLSINASAGATLLPGDMIGINTAAGGQLVQVVAATGTGTITADVSPPIKATVAPASPVVWNMPTARFIVGSPEIFVPYGKLGVDPGVTLDLIEV